MDSQRYSFELAEELDTADSLAGFRDQFHVPQPDGKDELYFVGNSLGLQPKLTAEYLQQELEQWASLGVRGHFEGDYPWMPYHEFLTETMAELVGGHPDEVVMMNSLTVNLHLMMASFYRPNSQRHKILIEDHAFPSDHYAVESQIKWHGLEPEKSLVLAKPDSGEETLRTEKVLDLIREHRDELALVMLPGVQYYTGQCFDMKAIAEVAREHEITVGFDLAHAAGNVAMALHEWGVDFAVWCSYKYLNSGPGSVAGCFVHRRHASNPDLNRLAGWWGHDKSTRFKMINEFMPIQTAEGWQLSNPPILSLAAIRASLDVFRQAGGMKPLREKSEKLTSFLLGSLKQELGGRVRSITPESPGARGCQLSLEIHLDDVEGRTVYEKLEATGVRTDWREPNVIRAAPVPLYNRFEETWEFTQRLKQILN